MKNFNLAAPLGRRVAGVVLAALVSIGSAWGQGPTFVSLNPASNTNNAAPNGLTAQFGVAPPLGATAGQGLKVFSSQRGGQRAGTSGTVSGPSATQLQFVPALGTGFLPGETVQVSLTSGIVANNGAGLTNPTVAQYTTATGGTGRGVFGPPTPAVLGTVGVGQSPNQVKLADIDNDGDLDMLTVNDGDYAVFPSIASTVSVRVNNGAGIFTPPPGGAGTVAVGPEPTSRCMTVGDVDNDGDIDLLAGNERTGEVSIRLNTGGGTFYDPGTTRGTLPTALGMRALALGDVDADGDLDLLAASTDVLVFLNDGTGLFGTPAANSTVALNNQTRGLALADVDGDGDLDMLAANIAAGTVSLRLNNGAGVFGLPPVAANGTIVTGAGTNQVTLGDLDGDGDLDFVADNYFGGTVSVRFNNGLGVFAPPAVAANAEVPASFAFDVALGDVDADGDLDLWFPGGSGVSVARNNGAGAFGPPVEAPTPGFSPFGLAVGDADADGDLDFVSIDSFNDAANVRLNGPGPEINVQVGGVTYLSGSTYDFGTVAVGATSPLAEFYVQNLSTDLSAAGVLTVSAVNVVRSPGITGTTGTSSLPFNLAAGSSRLTVQLTVRPTTPGPHSGTITISSDDPDESSYVINFIVTTVATPPAAVTWTGAVSTDWFTAGNWSPAQVPGNTTDVTIPAVPRQPLVSAAGAACASLTSASGTTLTIATGGYLAVGNNNVAYALQANGAVVMTGGTLEAQGLYVYFNGGLNATGGTVLLSGNSVQEVGTNGGGCVFWNLTVGPRASNQVRPYGGGFAVRRVLTLQGDINSGSVTLLSDAAGTAMVVNAGGRVQGVGTMQRYIGGPNAGLGYRHLSAPTVFGSVGSFYGQGYAPVVNANYNTTGNTARPFPNFFGYDEARQGATGIPGPISFDQGWVSPAATTDALAPGRGYTVNLPGTTTPAFGGYFATGPVAVGALSRSGSGPFAGYHLLGNPYPAPIDWDNVARPAGLDNAVYVFRSTGQYTGFYDSYVNGQGSLPNGEIAAMQGFFVHVSQAVPGFTFHDAARLTTYSNPTFRRGPADARPALALALRPAGGGAADKAFIYFEAGATAGLDGFYDAAKLPNPGGLNLASQLGGQDYAVNGLAPLGTAPLVLPLVVGAPAAGRYELAVDQLLNIAPGTALYLRDALLGTLTPLTPATRYAFTLAGTAAPGRFSIEFRPAGALASAAQVLEAQVQVFPNPAAAGASVSVAAPAGAVVSVFNALGQLVRPAATAGLALPTAGLAAGLYVLRVSTGTGDVSRKLVVE